MADAFMGIFGLHRVQEDDMESKLDAIDEQIRSIDSKLKAELLDEIDRLTKKLVEIEAERDQLRLIKKERNEYLEALKDISREGVHATYQSSTAWTMATIARNVIPEEEMNGIKPVAEYSDIVRTFEKMINDTGSTTTLDVKKELRNQGFWVKQADVSKALDAALDDEDGDKLSFYIDGNHRVYTLTDNVIPVPTVARVPTRAKRSTSLRNWKVTDGVTTHTFTGMTRNQARYAFSNMYDVPYISTKANIEKRDELLYYN